MEIKQGDIVSVDFPFSDGTQIKRRPALVLSGEIINQTGDILLMQITSKSRNDELSILIENSDLATPLPLKSFVRLHKVFTLDKSLIVKSISHLNQTKFDHVINAFIDLLKQ